MQPKKGAGQSGGGAGKAITIAQKALTIQDVLNKNAEKIQAALPKHITVEKMISVVMNSIRRNPRIAECTPISVFDCVMTSAQLGIPPDDIRGLAYIIPFNNRKKNVMEAQLMPGYKGFIHLAKESGEVLNVWSRVVYEGEDFSVQEGLEPLLRHTPLPPSKRGKPVGAYTCVELKTGVKGFTFMWEEEIQKIRSRSKAKDDGPWITDPDEMRKKTTIRRDMKMRDLSPKMNQAVALDELMDTDKPVRAEEFDTGEFMTEAMPGKPEVEAPKARDNKPEPEDAEVTEPAGEFKPATPEEEKAYSEIVDLTVAMRYDDSKIAMTDNLIKSQGVVATLEIVRKEWAAWQKKQKETSGETKQGTTQAPGTAGKSGTLL